MPLSLTISMILFCENDKRPPGVLKVFLQHAEIEKSKENWTVA